ncbi:MAG TPA: HAMP domain-containing sensor histidine kinase, partial [Actinospica sp.]|nr:HAMP domain-containing sensor histidine kinase [Actinospica sp.]
MSDIIQIVVIAGGCAAVVGCVGLIALWLLRGRAVRLKLFAFAVTVVCAMAAGVLATAQQMFLSQHDFWVMLVVCLAAGVVALTMAVLLARSFSRDSRALHSALRRLGSDELRPEHEGGVHRRSNILSTGEFDALRRELALTAHRLAESRERERAMERSRRELVAWVSHDLRTPLAGLRAMAEALEDRVAEDPAVYHTRIRQSVDRLTGMVDDLFELSRIHAGALRLSLEHIPLADLVDEAVVGADPLARARNVRLSADVRTGLSVCVDVGEVSRALTNLVANAIRHTPSDGAVRVEAAHRDGVALLAITDACGGIPADDLDRVFEVAWRGTPARTPEPQAGAGLGLAIVRGIVEAHAGEVDVHNVGRGCRFEVRLPIP